jgi:Holliday junction DNA helicase RuvA
VIGWLAGTVRFLEEDALCVDVNGVGYRLLVPVHDLARAAVGQKLELFVHTHVRDDAIVLFGFLTRDALVLFERLLACQGVGPKTALSLLSGMEPSDLVRTIADGDAARLTKIPGVGKKTAARIVLELSEKLAREGLPHIGPGAGRARGGAVDDLRSALANLGYKAPQIERALTKTKPLADEGKALPELVREALKHVG